VKEHLQHPIFAIIAEAAKELHTEAFVIGGYVRDILLNRPCKDVDIVSSGAGIELAERVAEKTGNSNKVTVFKNRYGYVALSGFRAGVCGCPKRILPQ
jgi:poly(A) polymerase